MKEQEKVFRELKKVTRELIRCGLAEEYNYPVIQQMDIVWEKYQNISLYLRNMDYSTIYDEIEKNHNYNVKLPDGGIIQLMYRFNRTGKELISHRLGYYPSPSYELYQNDPELYDVDYIYGDILNKSVLPVIIRADYNRDPEESELHHPYSHITLGGYKNCRIPVDRPYIFSLEFVTIETSPFNRKQSCLHGLPLSMIVSPTLCLIKCSLTLSRILVKSS